MKKIRIISFAIALIVMTIAGTGMIFAQESACKKYSDSESVYQGNYRKPLTISLDVSDCGKEVIINAKKLSR